MQIKYPPEAIDEWPSVRYGPNDQWQIFESAKDVPDGWEDHPSKVGQTKAKSAKDKLNEQIDL